MQRYIPKPDPIPTVDAVQFLPDRDPADVMCFLIDGDWPRLMDIEVEHTKLDHVDDNGTRTISSAAEPFDGSWPALRLRGCFGRHLVMAGDWIVRDQNGELQVLDQERFEASYIHEGAPFQGHPHFGHDHGSRGGIVADGEAVTTPRRTRL